MPTLTPVDPPSPPSLVGRLCKAYWRRWTANWPSVRPCVSGRGLLPCYLAIDAIAVVCVIALGVSLPWVLCALVLTLGDTARRCFELGPRLIVLREAEMDRLAALAP